MRALGPRGAAARLALAATLIVGPGVVLAYLGYTTLADRQESLRVTYGATATLLRDRLRAEVTSRLEAIERTSPLKQDLGSSAALARAWLLSLGNAHPWLRSPFVVTADNRIATADLWSGWRSRETVDIPADVAAELRAGEIAESLDRDLAAALAHYRRAESLATSLGPNALARSRVGRVLFKQGHLDESIRAYEPLIELPPEQTIRGLPLALAARLQIIDALAATGRGADAVLARSDALRWVLEHPWDLEAGYGPELARALQAAADATPGLRANAARVLDEIALLDDIRANPEMLSGSAASKNVFSDDAPRFIGLSRQVEVTVGFRNIRTAAGAPRALGFIVDPRALATLLEAAVMTGIDLGPDLRAGIVDAAGQSAADERQEPLATADLAPMLTGWTIALVDSQGRTLADLSARERWTSAGLVGGALFLLVVGVVVTARAWMREAQLARLRSDFVSNVSHELKTPLALIRMSGETLESGLVTDAARQREFHGIIRRESERLTHLIDNVLDTAQIEAGTRTFSRTRTDLGALVRDVLDAYAPLLGRQGFTVETKLPAGPVFVDADRDGVSQALVNLLQNAIKYSPDRRELRVSLSRLDDEVRLSMTDQGLGIAPAQLSRIFEPYYRATQDGLTAPAGSGLGLSIVQHVMRAHGGRVNVESRPGHGSTFSLVFPVQADAEPDAAPARAADANGAMPS